MGECSGHSFSGKKAAILVANGFCEQDVTVVQRALQAGGAATRIISMEDHGLANSWNGEGWGLHFAADAVLKSALAVDYSMLVIPGGRRSVEKLRLTAHTRRFLSGFLAAGKPVALFDEAVDLLVFAEQAEGRQVTGQEDQRDELVAHGAKWVDQACAIDDNLITGRAKGDEARETLVNAIINHAAEIFGRSRLSEVAEAA